MLKRFLIGCMLASFAALPFFAQPTKGDWISIASDDGRFSVEVPAQYSFFYDKEGFTISSARTDLPLRKMEMLNAIVDGSLVSFERYDGSKDALTRIYERDRVKKEVTENRELKDEGLKKRQLTSSTDKFFLIRQYFAYDNHIYVLTAASRDAETPAMRRFLDSVSVRSKDDPAFPDGTVPFASLTVSKVEVEDLTEKGIEPPKPADQPVPAKKPEPDEKPILFIVRPTPWYTDEARAALVRGNVMVKITFDANGFMPKISFLRTLPGLSRQAMFAALTLKFLPQEKAGTPKTVVKSLEYTFNIY